MSVPTPGLEFVFEARVAVGEALALGEGPLGKRRLVPITGGEFAGPRIRGRVLPGGADRQVLRADGARCLEALYELVTDDGAVLTLLNRVLVHESPTSGRYAFSHVSVTAPTGPHDWLNRLVLVGSLHSLKPQPAVRVCVYELCETSPG